MPKFVMSDARVFTDYNPNCELNNALQKKYKNAISFKNQFKVSNNLFNSIIKHADDNAVVRNLEEIIASKELIERGVKAAISKNLFNDFGYYVIINESDKTVQQAVKSFK